LGLLRPGEGQVPDLSGRLRVFQNLKGLQEHGEVTRSPDPPSAQRCSMLRFCPSSHPRSRRPRPSPVRRQHHLRAAYRASENVSERCIVAP
jgi:hypothetical protein